MRRRRSVAGFDQNNLIGIDFRFNYCFIESFRLNYRAPLQRHESKFIRQENGLKIIFGHEIRSRFNCSVAN